MKQVNDAHETEYEKLPEVTVSSPGRFHLIGEHSWFFKDKTLSMALNLPVYIAVSKRTDSSLRFYFAQLNERKRANLSSLKYRREDRWANAIKSIIYGFTSGGFEVCGMNFTIYSDILPSAGFGITTAIKTGTAVAVKTLLNLPCTEVQLLQVIERANRLFLHTGNYLADNYASLYSKRDTVLLTDHAAATYEYIPFNFADKTILLVDARVPRISTWNEEMIREGEYALLLGELKEFKDTVAGGWQYSENVTDVNEVLATVSEDVRRRLLCIMQEHRNVLEARDGLLSGQFGQFARAVNHSHESMRDLYDISCPEIDWILKRLSELDIDPDDVRNPLSCGRITGKGFGRCVYVFLPREDEPAFRKKLVEYERIFGFHPACYVVRPSSGVRIVE
ncbi:MAG: galactokinase [Treponema sp.]|jgi:galactokinase|nr:galactokinase [Treponema sp.]